MHHQLVIYEVETVRLCLVWMEDHLLNEILRELWEFIDVLTCVLTAGDAEPKFKIKTLQQLITEVMPLNHAEVIDGFVPYCEFHRGPHLAQPEEGWGELVAHEAPRVGIHVLLVIVLTF